MPPSNITVRCDEIKNDCVIQWQRPQISHSNTDKCFKYEINIKYKVRVISSPTFNINTMFALTNTHGQKENQFLLCGVAFLICSTILLCGCAFQAPCHDILPCFLPLFPWVRCCWRCTGWLRLGGLRGESQLIKTWTYHSFGCEKLRKCTSFTKTCWSCPGWLHLSERAELGYKHWIGKCASA